jgi:transmembrane sensor
MKKSLRETLVQRYLDDTITSEELETLKKMLAEDPDLMKMDHDLRAIKTLSDLRAMKANTQEDEDHVANDLFYEREEAEEKATVPMYRSGRFAWWSAAAAIVVAVTLGIYVKMFKDIDSPVASNQMTSEILISVKGPEFVILPDSSTVLLNKGSQLSYNKTFGKELREVSLIGEAFFDIKHDPSHKFVVHSGKVTTTVLGTAFNVKELPTQVVVTVTRGKVAVKDDVQEFGTITKNERFTVNTEKSICARTTVKEGIAEAWTSQFIIINNEPFQRAMEIFENKFNVDITVENEELRNCRVTIDFLEKPKFEEALSVLCSLTSATWVVKDGKVIIQGGKCNKNT